ncbi:MAG: hypothetical protein JSS66_08890 [Armatimonadetes bacterium]|nr:hypothetical protein [Armatimonadota bacterium]
MQARKRLVISAGVVMASAFASAQVPDLMNALDAGGRAMGIGGSTQATDSNTLSTYYNPAGLGYISDTTFSFAARNLPQSDNTISGNFASPDFSTSRESGPRRITHVGFATPMRGGVLGLSYTMGGYMKDFRSGQNLTDGGVIIQNYLETFGAQTDFFTLAWGKQMGQTNWGFGVVVANQYISDVGSYEMFDSENQFIGTTRIDNSGNTYGVGGIVGVQFSPSRDGKSQVGISVRTPISLSNNTSTSPYLNKVPGRASIGLASRTDPLRGGKDFIVYGAQLDYFFGSDKNGIFNRKDTLSGGIGFEYNYHRGNARIPIRAGYAFIPKGGDMFIERNTFTFGLGYRPDNSNLAVDVNFGLPSGGGTYDMGLSLTYKVGK